jgi:hypothetical protein
MTDKHGGGILNIISPGMKHRVKRKARSLLKEKSMRAPWHLPALERCSFLKNETLVFCPGARFFKVSLTPAVSTASVLEDASHADRKAFFNESTEISNEVLRRTSTFLSALITAEAIFSKASVSTVSFTALETWNSYRQASVTGVALFKNAFTHNSILAASDLTGRLALSNSP